MKKPGVIPASSMAQATTSSMGNVANTAASSQALSYPGSCKHCGSSNLFTKIEPPHIALRCRDCNAWQKWISKAKARRFQSDKVRLNLRQPGAVGPASNRQLTSDLDDRAVPISTPDAPPDDLHAEVPLPLSVIDLKTKVADTLSADLLARIEKLERAFAGYDSQLGILVRAILSCGVLQGKGAPEDVDVDSEDVYRLVGELAEGEERR